MAEELYPQIPKGSPWKILAEDESVGVITAALTVPLTLRPDMPVGTAVLGGPEGSVVVVNLDA